MNEAVKNRDYEVRYENHGVVGTGFETDLLGWVIVRSESW